MSAILIPTTADRSSRGPARAMLDHVLGPMLFFLGIFMLILAAGVLHRLGRGAWTAFEADVMLWGMLLCWPVFVLEGMVRLLAWHRPDTSLPRRFAVFVSVCLFPPLRIAGRGYADATTIWLPMSGWTVVDERLRRRLERVFSVPMFVITLLVLPLLAMEYFWLEQVRGQFLLSLVLDIGTSVIWLAFALELIIMASVAESKAEYCMRHWIDVAVVMMPLVDFLPILRLARLTGLLEFQQVSRLSRLYRLRALLSRGWRAVLLLEMIQRLFSHYQENRLVRLKQLLAARQQEVADLSVEIAELESAMAPVGRTDE